MAAFRGPSVEDELAKLRADREDALQQLRADLAKLRGNSPVRSPKPLSINGTSPTKELASPARTFATSSPQNSPQRGEDLQLELARSAEKYAADVAEQRRRVQILWQHYQKEQSEPSRGEDRVVALEAEAGRCGERLAAVEGELGQLRQDREEALQRLRQEVGAELRKDLERRTEALLAPLQEPGVQKALQQRLGPDHGLKDEVEALRRDVAALQARAAEPPAAARATEPPAATPPPRTSDAGAATPAWLTACEGQVRASVARRSVLLEASDHADAGDAASSGSESPAASPRAEPAEPEKPAAKRASRARFSTAKYDSIQEALDAPVEPSREDARRASAATPAAVKRASHLKRASTNDFKAIKELQALGGGEPISPGGHGIQFDPPEPVRLWVRMCSPQESTLSFFTGWSPARFAVLSGDATMCRVAWYTTEAYEDATPEGFFNLADLSQGVYALERLDAHCIAFYTPQGFRDCTFKAYGPPDQTFDKFEHELKLAVQWGLFLHKTAPKAVEDQTSEEESD